MAGRGQPGQVALSDDRGAELTYAELLAAVEASAAAFAAAGVGPGDVVPVIARNQAGWVTAVLGLIRAGALPAAVNWRLAAPEVTALLELMTPAAMVTDDDCAALVAAAAAPPAASAAASALGGTHPRTAPPRGHRAPGRPAARGRARHHGAHQRHDRTAQAGAADP